MVVTENLDATLKLHRSLVEDFSFPTVREWKSQHPRGKVIGYFPVYMPLEIVHAAGMLPMGLLGAGLRVPIKEADSYFPSFVCSIPRTTIELALSGRLDFLDAIFFTPICDVARTQAAIWQRNLPGITSDLLALPQNLTTPGAVEYLHGEYQRLVALLEDLSGVAITKRALQASLGLYNHQRRLLRQLYALRRDTPWKLSAVESYVVTRVGTLLPVGEHIRLLEQMLAQAPQRDARPRDKVRVLFEGAFCEQPPLEYIETLEEVCYIVDDDFEVTQRWFLDDVPEDGDPLLSLARSYGDLMGYSSVQHHGGRPKGPEFMKKLRRANATAAILSPAKMCEPGLDDQVLFADYLKKEGVPYLTLEVEEKANSFEDTRVQVETFAESLLFYP